MPAKRPDEEITIKVARSPRRDSGFHEAVTNHGGKRTVSKRRKAEDGVETYLAKLPVDQLEALQRVRKLVRELVPDATEDLHYQVPTFMYHGPLVAYAAGKKHCSFFVRSHPLMKTMERELAPYFAGPGTLRFTAMEPIPTTVIKAIVLARMRENEAAKPG